MKKTNIFIIICLLVVQFLQAQLTIRVSSIPNNTPPNSNIFIAGNFNNWNPQSVNYQLVETQAGQYQINLNIAPQTIQFKFTRGSWETVEGDENGSFINNHSYIYSGGLDTLYLPILGWEEVGGTQHTATENTKILTDSFFMPQLNRYRRIWIYLPPNYSTSTQYYRVMYMHDGQNLFDAATSFSGEWQVDETLNQLFDSGDEGCIVVGIDNGGANRINEYTPWANPNYGGGQGSEYMSFIVATLKPYIDTHYRTKSEREHTAIMGSSLGGLISMYGSLTFQNTFSKAGIFSPSFWFSPNCYTQVANTGNQEEMRYYMIAGGNEEPDDQVVTDMFRMKDTLTYYNFDAENIRAITHSDGTHSESYWRREFGAAYQWLFQTTTKIDNLNLTPLKIYPNPVKDTLTIECENNQVGLFVIISNEAGQIVSQFQLQRTTINVSHYKSGLYFMTISDEGKMIQKNKFIKQ
ncbi:MAG: T9SS type A sorting domain-containing protein [Saprospiraceae bacterium]|nr:T9SS type A sorting domain-containing protein [Saprospiraceae bacterium]